MVESAAESSASERKKSRLAALERKHTTSTSPSPHVSNRSPAASSIHLPSAVAVPSSTASPFRTPASSNPKPDPSDRTHAKLCPSVFNGPLASNLQLRKDNSNLLVDTVLRELLASNAKTAGSIASTIENRTLDKPLVLDNPATQGRAIARAKERASRARSKRSTKHLSMRQHRQAGSFDMPAECQKYELFLPMHNMWKEYANTLVTDCNDSMIQSRLLAADLHGAILSVLDSKSTSYVGTQGIMVRETDNTFGIMTIKDKFRVVPKAGTVFRLQLDSLHITLFGNNLFSRSLHPGKRQKTNYTIKI